MTPDSPQGGGAWPGNKPQSRSGAKADSRSADARWGLRRHGRKSRGRGGPRGPERTERPPGFVSLTGMPSPPTFFFTPRRCSAGLGVHRCTGAESEKTPPSRAPPGLAGGGVPPRPSLPCTSGGRQRRGPRAPASAVCTVKTGRGARWKLRSGAGRSPPAACHPPSQVAQGYLGQSGAAAGAGAGRAPRAGARKPAGSADHRPLIIRPRQPRR